MKRFAWTGSVILFRHFYGERSLLESSENRQKNLTSIDIADRFNPKNNVEKI